MESGYLLEIAERQSRTEERIDATNTTMRDHLRECAARFRSLQSLVLRISGFIIALLLAIIGWLVTHVIR